MYMGIVVSERWYLSHRSIPTLGYPHVRYPGYVHKRCKGDAWQVSGGASLTHPPLAAMQVSLREGTWG
jgi:hypothetical protein